MVPRASEPQVPLRLRPDEQWLLHHVLSERIEAVRRSEARRNGPAIDLLGAFKKVEEGTHFFTPAELELTQVVLEAYRRRSETSDTDERAVDRLLERIDAAMVPKPGPAQ